MVNRDLRGEALKNTLIEIRNICPDINSSFIFTKDGQVMAGDTETAEITIKRALESFQSVKEKAGTIGGLHNFFVDGDKGKVHISRINNMYLVTSTSRNADASYLRSVTQVVLPTILKLLESVFPAPLKWG
jgi:predicted regulator of Ras-like GTPase activity (Roadblock/LC7/MglB family)